MKRLDKPDRKRLQIEHAPHTSRRAAFDDAYTKRP